MSVTATRGAAIIQAGIDLAFIAVIAGFKSIVSSGAIEARDAISAARRLARCRTGILGDGIAIITAFLRIVLSVAASFNAAVGSAAIAGFVIAIITRLKAFGSERSIAAQDTVAAARSLTDVGAGIVIDAIGIITGFDARLNQSVATARRFANIAACVILGIVTIVAGFVTTEDAVAAARCRTGRGASVTFIGIAVVALFKAKIALGQVLT